MRARQIASLIWLKAPRKIVWPLGFAAAYAVCGHRRQVGVHAPFPPLAQRRHQALDAVFVACESEARFCGASARPRDQRCLCFTHGIFVGRLRKAAPAIRCCLLGIHAHDRKLAHWLSSWGKPRFGATAGHEALGHHICTCCVHSGARPDRLSSRTANAASCRSVRKSSSVSGVRLHRTNGRRAGKSGAI